MNANELRFPALGKTSQGMLVTIPTRNHLTTNTAAGLRGGYYRDFRVLDSTGQWFRVTKAKKADGVGPFGGYNLFLNQRIHVALDLAPEEKSSSVDEVRDLVMKEFREWDGWRSRADFADLRRRVQLAPTVGDLLGVLAEAAV